MSENQSRPSAGVRISVPDVSRHAHRNPGEMKAALKDVFRLGEQNIPAPPPSRAESAEKSAVAVPAKPPAESSSERPSAPREKPDSLAQGRLKRWMPGRRQLIVLMLAGLLMGLPAAIAYWPVAPPSDGTSPPSEPAEVDAPGESKSGDAPKSPAPSKSTPDSEGPFLHDAAESTGNGSMVHHPAGIQPGVAHLEGVILKPTLKASHDDPAIKLR